MARTGTQQRENRDKNDKKTQTQGGKRSDAQTSPTGERDEHYNLVSVLYHALKGAETCVQYKRDAEAADDEELAEFFDAARERQVELAQEAKQLLAARVERDEDEDDQEDDEEEDEN